MKIERVNIGVLIKRKVIESGITNAAFAKSIGIQRQNIEKTVFTKNSIDTDLLIIISEFLDFNFFQYYKSESENIISNNIDYTKQEIKATLTIEMGKEKKDQIFRFIFGDNNVEIQNK